MAGNLYCREFSIVEQSFITLAIPPKNIKDSTHDAFLRCPPVLNAESHIQKSQEDIAMLRNRLRSLLDLWRNEQKSWTPKIRGFEESGCDTQV